MKDRVNQIIHRINQRDNLVPNEGNWQWTRLLTWAMLLGLAFLWTNMETIWGWFATTAKYNGVWKMEGKKRLSLKWSHFIEVLNSFISVVCCFLNFFFLFYLSMLVFHINHLWKILTHQSLQQGEHHVWVGFTDCHMEIAEIWKDWIFNFCQLYILKINKHIINK